MSESGGGGFEVVIQAPVNIALIKYWGKRNEDLVLPLNDSISLAINDLQATTEISIGPHIAADSVTLNGVQIDLAQRQRFRRVFEEIRKYSRKRTVKGDAVSKTWHIRIVSHTNFPTAAGLASSAARFAAIAYGLGQIFRLPERDIVRLARIGSGSACRSIQDGFVHWRAGTRAGDDADCVCESLAPRGHWPQLRALVVVVSEQSKRVGSSEGMRSTVRTSALLNARVREVVPKLVERLKEAIRERDFATLAEITMAESNQLHAVCMDTRPPLNYLNDTSHALMHFVHDFNSAHGPTPQLAYTFDAGPNCCLLFEQHTFPRLKMDFERCFDFECEFPKCDEDKDRAENGADQSTENVPDSADSDSPSFPWPTRRPIHISRFMLSQVGTGPRVIRFTNSSSDGGDGLSIDQQAGNTTSVNCKML